MKHVVLFVAALILLVFAGVVIVPNRHALTVVHLGFGGGCILLAFALAIPADFKNACATVAPYIPVIRGSAPPAA
jgi:hypothetical protein